MVTGAIFSVLRGLYFDPLEDCSERINLLCQEVKIHSAGAARSVTLSHGSGGLQPEGVE